MACWIFSAVSRSYNISTSFNENSSEVPGPRLVTTLFDTTTLQSRLLDQPAVSTCDIPVVNLLAVLNLFSEVRMARGLLTLQQVCGVVLDDIQSRVRVLTVLFEYNGWSCAYCRIKAIFVALFVQQLNQLFTLAESFSSWHTA